MGPQLLIIATEPAPYKVDTFNALADALKGRVLVVWARLKDPDSEGAHHFVWLPEKRFEEFAGAGLKAALTAMMLHPSSAIMVSGYVGLPYLGSLLASKLSGRCCLLWIDRLNLSKPRVKGPASALTRRLVRSFSFTAATWVLTAGRPGIEAAIRAGCPSWKVFSFPYLVDHNRYTIKNGPVAERIRKHAGKRPIIFFPGRLIKRKGLDLLILASSRLQEYKPLLVVVGDGPMRSEVEEMARKLRVDAMFLSFLQGYEYVQAMAASDIVVVPSRYDAWGIAVHEAMVAGKAVVASDAVGSAMDRIENGRNGLLFPSGDVEALEAALRKLLKNRELIRRLGSEAMQTARMHKPEVYARKVARLLEGSCL